jgi:exopolyphosphatase/guanosine-5'-triphosphate,3'-diphosphate pyrophosphatase
MVTGVRLHSQFARTTGATPPTMPTTTTFAAIDIGSNSCRLKIARVVVHHLKTIHEDREVTRLGASVFDSGLISPEAMAITLKALKRFQRAVQQFGVDQIRVVATAAMRDARNAEAFLTWVKAETGWLIEIISGLEEARLIHRGVVFNEPKADRRLLLIDVGGGSCEITLSQHRRIQSTISLPLGAVRLTQEFLPTDPPDQEALARMQQFITRELRRAHSRIQIAHPASLPMVIATSGTASALAEAHRILPDKFRRLTRKSGAARASAAIVDHVTTAQVRQLARRLRKMTLPERIAVPGIGLRRAEIIVAGAWVYATLLESFHLTGFRYSPMGVRDGILAQMLAEHDERALSHEQFEQERWESVQATAIRFGVNLRQAEPVRAHAVQLFDHLAALHKLPVEYRTWLAAAAVLCETGKFLNHQGHHRHSQYIIASSEIYGFSQQQRTLVSAIARYLGKSRPQPDDRVMRNLTVQEHEPVCRAVVLLRLAIALNQDRASDVVRFSARVLPRRVLLELEPGRTGAELELWSLRKEAAYFREVFGRELFVTLV